MGSSSWIPNKKAQKIDQISNLPDCVISRILSSLPIKDAVKTSVLSKDWEYQWTSIDNVELNDAREVSDESKKATLVNFVKLNDAREVRDESKKATFVNFVERALLLLQNVQSFRLSCYRKCNLDPIVLPRNLFNCNSLRELAVVYPCTLKVPSEICLPQLKTLHLERVNILNELSNFDLVQFNFPDLETVELIECRWLNVKFVDIYAPKMTSFTCQTAHANAGVNDYSIKITGDSLLKFNFCGTTLTENIFISGGGSDVVYAALEIRHGRYVRGLLGKSGLQIRKLLKGFSSLKDLKLSGPVGQAFVLSKLRGSLPMYYKMERLVLENLLNTDPLFELLHAAPFLKVLHIGLPSEWNDNNAYDAENIPSCIVSHLEEVVFTNVDGHHSRDFKLAKFFLKNAAKLKSLRIRRFAVMSKNRRGENEEDLLTYPRASASLNTVFT